MKIKKIPDEFIEEMANLYRIKKDALSYSGRKEIEGGLNTDMIKWLKNTHSTFENFLLYRYGLK